MSEKNVKKRWFPWRFLLWISLFWLVFVSISAYFTTFELGQTSPFFWAPAYFLSLPVSHLALSEFYYYGLCIQYPLLENPLLCDFVIGSLYWPACFFLFGVVDWVVIYLILRTAFRLVRKFLPKKDASCALSQTEAPHDELSRDDSLSPPSGKRRKLTLGRTAALLFLLGMAWWCYFITVNLNRCLAWDRDFKSTRILISRFYHQNGRLPIAWEEIVESTAPLRHVTGRVELKPGEHYGHNPGLPDRIDLNFAHFQRMNEENTPASDDWIMRVREQSDENSTGTSTVHYEALWQNRLENIITMDRFHRASH